MKKLFIILTAIAMISVAGCQKPADNSENIPGYDASKDANKPSGKDDPSVTPEEQIEKTARALMDALDLPNWQADAEFVRTVLVALDSKHYNFETLESWADDLVEAWNKGSRQDDGTTIYVTMVRLSDAKGHFEEQPDGSFSYTKASDLQIILNINGEKVTATCSCTDSKVPVKVARNVYWDGAGYSGNETYVYVPTNVTLKILRGNDEFATLVLNTTVDVKNQNEPSPFTDSAKLNATLKLSVYTLAIQKVEYSPTGASVAVKFLNGNNSLITVGADATYTLNENNQDLPVKSGSANVSLDIMGMIQLKGIMPDYPAFQAALEKTYEEQERGGYQYQNAVEAFEKTFSATMYFNGSSTARATLGMEAMKSEYSEYWYMNPVIRFADGKSYGIDEYFSERRFGDLMDDGESWWENIKRTVDNMFGEYIH